MHKSQNNIIVLFGILAILGGGSVIATALYAWPSENVRGKRRMFYTKIPQDLPKKARFLWRVPLHKVRLEWKVLIVNPDNEPVAHAVIDLLLNKSSGPVDSARTNDIGRATLRARASTDYTLRMSCIHSDDIGTQYKILTEKELKTREITWRIDPLKPAIKVRAFTRRNGKSTPAPDGTVIRCGLIPKNRNGAIKWYKVYSKDGVACFNGLPAGKYKITVHRNSPNQYVFNTLTELSYDGEHVTEVEGVLVKLSDFRGSLKVTVNTLQGKQVVGENVLLLDSDKKRFKFSKLNTDGLATFRNLTAGQYTVVFKDDNYFGASKDVNFPIIQRNAALTVTRIYKVEVNVERIDFTKVKSAKYQLYALNGRGLDLVRSPKKIQDNTTTLKNLTSGTYLIKVWINSDEPMVGYAKFQLPSKKRVKVEVSKAFKVHVYTGGDRKIIKNIEYIILVCPKYSQIYRCYGFRGKMILPQGQHLVFIETKGGKHFNVGKVSVNKDGFLKIPVPNNPKQVKHAEVFEKVFPKAEAIMRANPIPGTKKTD